MHDSDEELSDLDVQSKTWDKLVQNMKTIGFREGASKGRENSFQEGFNLGYSDGFLIGEYLGVNKGIASFIKKFGDVENTENSNSNIDNDLENISSELCVMCQLETENKKSECKEVHSYNLDDILLLQTNKTNEIKSKLKNLNLSIKFPKRKKSIQ